jgi:uncharacterized protein YkwD
MNLVDALLLLVILFSIYLGYQKGFLIGALDLIALALSLMFAFRSYPYIAAFIQRHSTSMDVWSLPLAFIASFFFARIILSMLISAILRNTPQGVQRDPANKLLGIIPGAINGLINAAILSAILLAAPLLDGLSANTRESKLADRFVIPVERAEDKFAPVFDKAVRHSINSLTVEEESKKFITLPFSVKGPEIRPDLEQQMLILVNKERAKEGLSPLVEDTALRTLARAYSKDMFARSYFSHTNPDGKTLADRLHEAHIRYLSAGENLALAPTLTTAHNGLMNSPGHRANILQKSFGRVGIGVLEGGRYGLMITQEFRN